jgi:hypothetical protein
MWPGQVRHIGFVGLGLSSFRSIDVRKPPQVEGRLAGDSLELSALRGSGWSYDGNRSVALPPATGKKDKGKEKEKEKEKEGLAGVLRILVRHPFSAALQVRWGWGYCVVVV